MMDRRLKENVTQKPVLILKCKHASVTQAQTSSLVLRALSIPKSMTSVSSPRLISPTPLSSVSSTPLLPSPNKPYRDAIGVLSTAASKTQFK